MNSEFSGFFRDVSAEEFNKFGEYLSSTYFGIPKRMFKLYTLLKQNSKNPQDTVITREEITKHFYGISGKKEKASVRKLISEFKQYFREFTAQQVFGNDILAKAKCELKWYELKQNYGGYKKKTNETSEYLMNNTPRDEEFYINMTELYSRLFNVTDFSLDHKRIDDLLTINSYLDKYFVSMKIFFLQRFESMKYTSGIEKNYDLSFSHPIMNYINDNSEELKNDHPEIYLRYISYLLDKNGYDESLYYKYLAILDKASAKFKINENGFYSTLLNMISKFINHGAFFLDEKVINIGKLLLDKKIAVNYGISYIDLKIIIESYIGLKNYSDGLEFLEKIKDHVKNEDKLNVYFFLKAKLLFFSGSYSESRILLNKITLEDFIYYCEARLIELRISLTENNTDAVLNISENVLKYLKKHSEIGQHYITAYKIFVNTAREFTMFKNKNLNKDDMKFYMNRLKEQVRSNPVPCYAKNWLIELISAYEKQ